MIQMASLVYTKFTSMADTGVSRLLGFSQIRALREAWHHRLLVEESGASGYFVLLVLVMTLVPGMAVFFWGGIPALLVTALVALVAARYERTVDGSQQQGRLWGCIKIVHTAFALGVLPLLILMWVVPNSLVDLASQKVAAGPSDAAGVGLLGFVGTLIAIAFFTGITEELIFRGLLVRVLRRWNWWSLFSSPHLRDVAAVILSAALFAVVHLPFWGIYMSIAVFGLGLGLGVGFVANGEHIGANIVYHCSFNFLSLLCSAIL